MCNLYTFESKRSQGFESLSCAAYAIHEYKHFSFLSIVNTHSFFYLDICLCYILTVTNCTWFRRVCMFITLLFCVVPLVCSISRNNLIYPFHFPLPNVFVLSDSLNVSNIWSYVTTFVFLVQKWSRKKYSHAHKQFCYYSSTLRDRSICTI